MKESRVTLFIDDGLGGHHQTYLRGLIQAAGGRIIVCGPAGGEALYPGIERYYTISETGKSLKQYLKLFLSLIQIVRREKPDIVHFVYGDAYYRFGGLGMRLIRGKRIVTWHQFRRCGRIAQFMYCAYAKTARTVVLHTDQQLKTARAFGVSNAVHIEYPQFNLCSTINQADAIRRLDLPDDGTPVLLALGGTRRTKGLDLLLEALRHVQAPFYLLVAGKEEDFHEEYIREASKEYAQRVFLKLRLLSEEEVDWCLKASDIVCLPYRRRFDGASGPLGEGVYRGKLVVGPKHGSLGELIRDYHLGLNFEAENIESLTAVLERALTLQWQPDAKYREYQEQLNPGRFISDYARLYLTVEE